MEQIGRCELIVHDMDSELQSNVAKAEELVNELEASRRRVADLELTCKRLEEQCQFSQVNETEHGEDMRAKLDAAEGRARALENELVAVKDIAKSLREQLKRYQVPPVRSDVGAS
eukprot:768589-Hanusia_phi.AAC.1